MVASLTCRTSRLPSFRLRGCRLIIAVFGFGGNSHTGQVDSLAGIAYSAPINQHQESRMSAQEKLSFINDPNLRVLISEEQLRERVRAMGEQITRDYAGKNLHLLGVLKGACVFLSDLMRAIDLPVSLDFIGISSYGAATKSSGEVRITKDLDVSLAGKDVLVVEDIIDTGLTLNYMVNIFRSREVNSLAIAAL